MAKIQFNQYILKKYLVNHPFKKQNLETFFNDLCAANTSIEEICVTKEKIYDFKGNENVNYNVQIRALATLEFPCEFNIKTESLIEKEEIEKKGIEAYVENYLKKEKPDFHLHITANKFGKRKKIDDKKQIREIIQVNEKKTSFYNSLKKKIGDILDKPTGNSMARY